MARVKPPQERRREERQRTRLRSGKIVNLDGRFVVECQFIDIAPHGAKIRVREGPIPAGTILAL
ncbi:hypothetical protein C048_02930 [Brucella melitensis UK19/04]|nr:type IV pilus assembly PilZ [Brucella melitensis bv. 1 str. 16M]EEZ12647.1 type IV pilus assembly PilZ [Brucella melitensis bv. 1 str. Rev.1]ENQ68885.1 hypothetical protein C962_02923 [Brucella melitensis CNGB 1076]ENQ71918.1 hypothetical protein C963_02927 [Brucella melitensis CNGB 1120]ENQ74792.1 hypothetical protein C964_02921 [Brucella melitensis CNGB 290]ENQ78465.1 hypothetical protein C057_02260 [Brucella melitensis F10/05-2]ENQ84515.1 hypothetical protein C056_02239 [Brucella melite